MGGYRSNPRGSGRGFGGGGGAISFGFPPFYGAVKTLVIINVVVYFVVLLGNIGGGGFSSFVFGKFGFTPAAVVHGWLWQFISYGFLHSGISHILVNMLSLWMFGSQLEGDWGKRRFYEFYFFCMIGAGLTMVALTAAAYAAAGQSTNWFVLGLARLFLIPTVGASGAVYGILVAFGMLHGEQELFLFPLPFRIKAKYMVALLVLLVFASSLQLAGGATAEFAHLGGILFGFLYVKFVGRRSLAVSISEGVFGARNSYYKWKRRRAARKFEVYMRNVEKKPVDLKQYFDEYGNYRGPNPGGEKKEGNDRPPWVN